MRDITSLSGNNLVTLSGHIQSGHFENPFTLIIRQRGTMPPFNHVHDRVVLPKMLNVCSVTSVLFTVLTFVGFAALENLKESKDINRAWENIKDNIKTSVQQSLGLYVLKQHKP
jgi:hypothetical protein